MPSALPIAKTDSLLLVATDSSLLNGIDTSSAGKVTTVTPTDPIDGTYDMVVSASAQPHNDKQLQQIAKALKPGGAFIIREQRTNQSGRTERDLFLTLTLAGFVDTKTRETSSTFLEVSSVKPQWEQGVSSSLLKKNTNKLSAAPATATTQPIPKKNNVWSISSEDIDDAELEDEDSLLAPEDRIVKKQDDCEIGKEGARKACKNCSCGRAEKEAGATLETFLASAKSEPGPSSSACGNCYLGDAFRCSGCPHRGKPAFKPGEVVSLDLDDQIDI